MREYLFEIIKQSEKCLFKTQSNRRVCNIFIYRQLLCMNESYTHMETAAFKQIIQTTKNDNL